MAKLDSAILGACGEYYVAAFLSRFQLIVGLPRAGVPGCDLLIANEDCGPGIRLQVKTGTDSRRTDKAEGPIYLWHTGFKVIEWNHKDLWYAYVWINGWPHGNDQPEIFFVPAAVVVETMMKVKAAGEMGFFWMKVGDAAQYQGAIGLRPILEALRNAPASA